MLEQQFADFTVDVVGVSSVQRSSDAPALDEGAMTCIALYGVMLTPRRVLTSMDGSAQPSLTFDEAVDANGEWLAVFQHRDHPDDIVVLTDAFAFQTLFHATVDGEDGARLVLGSSAAGVAYRRNIAGQAMDPDWPVIVSLLSTYDPWSSTLSSDRTSDRAVGTMRPFEMMRIRGGRATIVPRADWSRAQGKGYEELIAAGVKTAVAQLRTLVREPFASRRINLSGGKDSRMMFALMNAAQVTDGFDVRSVNPRTWHSPAGRPGLEKDLLIADALRQHYGMSWWKETSTVIEPADPFETLEAWQAFHSSRNFRFRLLRDWTTRPGTVAELRGASGETFREYWSYYWKRHARFPEVLGTPESYRDDARVLFESIYPVSLFPADLVDAAFEHFLESLEGTGKDDILDAGDRHFSLYRNRAHFGTTMQFAQEGTLPFFPLNQTAFVLAGDLLDPAERRRGAVFFDIIDSISPELNDLPFDAKQWDDSVRARRAPGVEPTAWHLAENIDELTEFFANEELSAQIRKGSKPPLKRHHIYTDPKPFAAAAIAEHIAELRTLHGADEAVTDDLVAFLVDLPESNAGHAQTQLGKLASIRDLVVGRRPGRAIVLDPSARASGGVDLFRRRSTPVPSTFRRVGSHVLFRVQFDASETGLRAQALVDHSEGHDLEFSFSLHTRSVEITRTAFSAERDVTFDRPSAQGPFHVVAEARYRRSPERTVRLASIERA